MQDNKRKSPLCPKCQKQSTYSITPGVLMQTALFENKSIRGSAKYHCVNCGHNWKKYRGKKPYEQIKMIQAFTWGYPGPSFHVKIHLEQKMAEAKWTKENDDFALEQALKVFGEKEIEWFRAELYQCDFVNWAEEYFMLAMDGTNWKVQIEYETHCEIKTGSNHFPPKWAKFCKAVSKMSGQAFY